jgi:hypothetical protein
MTRRTKALLAAASAAALALPAIAPASAAPVTFTSFTISEPYSAGSPGGPSVSNVLSSPLNSYTLGNAVNAFTLGPYGSCTGGGCRLNVESDPITVQFFGLAVNGVSAFHSLAETGLFTARYSGSELACAVGNGKSPTDCVVWTGASSAWNGSVTPADPLSNGQALDVTFKNATDWNITPTVRFNVSSAPEASTWGMMLAGFAGLAYAGAHRSRKTARYAL